MLKVYQKYILSLQIKVKIIKNNVNIRSKITKSLELKKLYNYIYIYKFIFIKVLR